MQANRKTIIALMLLAASAAFSTASISTNYDGKNPKKPKADDLAPQLEALEQRVEDLQAMVTAIHGPTLPEPPENPPPPEGGYAVYDVYGDFVGTTGSGSEVRIILDQYPDLYFLLPAFEKDLTDWAREVFFNFRLYPDSSDCSSQPYLLSSARINAYSSISLLNPTPVINSLDGLILNKDGVSNVFLVSDPNNDAEAVPLSVEGGSYIQGYGGSCQLIDPTYTPFDGAPVAVPAEEVTIDIAYPLQVIFDEAP
ncbi:hypothetical protein ACFL3Y_01005 [Pseudomonadota bacterium]